MNNDEILNHVDHTYLKPFATWENIEKLCNEALEYHTASVCIPPCFIKRVKETFPNLNICTVIGFPLGYNTTQTKVFETVEAINDGANEIDMVINITDAKSHSYEKITEEIKSIKNVCGNKILKVIVETCYLDEDEKVELCKCVSDAKADYIKTSTGFGSGGATVEDLNLFAKHIDSSVKIKAAGGIKTKQDIDDFLNAGADRLGSSSAIKILNEK